jgi:hypothetical protein
MAHPPPTVNLTWHSQPVFHQKVPIPPFLTSTQKGPGQFLNKANNGNSNVSTGEVGSSSAYPAYSPPPPFSSNPNQTSQPFPNTVPQQRYRRYLIQQQLMDRRGS